MYGRKKIIFSYTIIVTRTHLFIDIMKRGIVKIPEGVRNCEEFMQTAVLLNIHLP